MFVMTNEPNNFPEENSIATNVQHIFELKIDAHQIKSFACTLYMMFFVTFKGVVK